MQTEGAGDRSINSLVSGWPSLPPEPLSSSFSSTQVRRAKLHFRQLFIFSWSHQVLTLFLEGCYDASISFAPDKTEALAHSLQPPPPPPSPIVLCSACFPLISSVFWHTPPRMRSWPGRPQVVVMTLFSLNCPLKVDAAHIGFHTMVRYAGDSSELLGLFFPMFIATTSGEPVAKGLKHCVPLAECTCC